MSSSLNGMNIYSSSISLLQIHEFKSNFRYIFKCPLNGKSMESSNVNAFFFFLNHAQESKKVDKDLTL